MTDPAPANAQPDATATSALRERAARLAPPRLRVPMAVGAVALCAVVLGWAIHSGRLTKVSGFDRENALRQTDRATDFLRAVRAQRERRPELDARLARVSNATLGGRLESVDSAVRARLNRIGEESGLRDLMVATAPAIERKNPGRSDMNRLNLPRSLRDEADFVEVRATIGAEGAVDQVLRLVHRIAVDPMLKRIESVRFDPARDGSRVRITLKLATIFMPGAAPDELPGAPSAEAIASASASTPCSRSEPFRLPEPAAPTAAAPAAVAAASVPASAPVAPVAEPIAGFPYGQWLLTGIIDGPVGTEAWFRNDATQEARVLRVNETIAEFALVGLTAHGARMSAGGATYVVRVGDSLEARAMETAQK